MFKRFFGVQVRENHPIRKVSDMGVWEYVRGWVLHHAEEWVRSRNPYHLAQTWYLKQKLERGLRSDMARHLSGSPEPFLRVAQLLYRHSRTPEDVKAFIDDVARELNIELGAKLEERLREERQRLKPGVAVRSGAEKLVIVHTEDEGIYAWDESGQIRLFEWRKADGFAVVENPWDEQGCKAELVRKMVELGVPGEDMVKLAAFGSEEELETLKSLIKAGNKDDVVMWLNAVFVAHWEEIRSDGLRIHRVQSRKE
jgi:hypothetical protein